MTGSADGELEPGVEARARSSSARGSDEQASVTHDLEEVYRRHADFVWRVARRLGVPDGAVEDVMHEVFLVLHRRLPEFDGRASMTTWLYNITRGVVSNYRRGRSREARRLALVEPKLAVPDPEQATGRKQAAAFVRRFVASLPDDKRVVFELADLEGMPIPEVAAVCGIKLNTAYSRLRAARQQFQRAVDRFRREQSERSGAA